MFVYCPVAVGGINNRGLRAHTYAALVLILALHNNRFIIDMLIIGHAYNN